MALDRTKVLEAAQKHLARGAYDKAIAEYQRLVQDDPSDVRTWLKIGDLYTRKGAHREACDTYLRVARQYAEQGFFLKAVAVYKQVLKLDPSRLDVQLSLAEMYEQLQLVSDALATYEQVATAYAREGQSERALETLRRMAELDPENVPVRIRLAEALSKAGRTEEAAEAFAASAAVLRQQGRLEDYARVAERLLFHRPSDLATTRELAVFYLDRADPKRALAKLQVCFKAEPRDVQTLELLARAFQQLGQQPKAVSVLKEIARLHHEAGRSEQRLAALRQVLELDPGDAEARLALSGGSTAARQPPPAVMPPPGAVVEPRSAARPVVAPPAPAALAAAPRLERPSTVYESDPEPEEVYVVEEEDEVPPRKAMAAPSASARSPEPRVAAQSARSSGPSVKAPDAAARASVPPDVAHEAQIARMLTECDVYLRYGLRAKVVDQLRRVLELAPQHVEARERLKDMLLALGRVDEAIAELYELERLFSDRPEVSQLYLRQILELDPTSEPARSMLTDGVEESADEAPETAAPDDEVFFVAEDETMLDAPEMAADARPAPVVGARQPDVSATVPSRDARPPDGAAPVPVPAPRPEPADAVPDLDREMSPEEFEAVPVAPAPSAADAAVAPRPSLPPGEVEEVLEEVEFFLAQGLYAEARASLEEALSTSRRGHPLLREKLAEIEEIIAAERGGTVAVAATQPNVEVPRAAAVPGTVMVDESFQLAERLALELGPEATTSTQNDAIDVDAVFEQFKKGVAEQVGVEDSDTHFDLGIAYKEMGLLDDAIAEFDLARRSPHRECMAYTMMGICYVEKGMLAEAIGHFKKGLYAEHKTEREELGLYFELGAAYEAMQDVKEALYYFQKVHKRDPTFRDVGARIQALASPVPAPAPAAPSGATDDIDRIFDELLGDEHGAQGRR
ncbi:MAG: tetratricopeptide repeat protein [Myxococcota bacterium]|nr:tetratricopeptide repeat protein [Myxococcota bacterium]